MSRSGCLSMVWFIVRSILGLFLLILLFVAGVNVVAWLNFGCDRPPEVVQLGVRPSQINAGESATLFWCVDGALKRTISIDQGIGSVDAIGEMSVSPSSNITYTISAANYAGIATRSVVLTVDGDALAAQPSLPNDFIIWDKAKDHIGEVKVIEGTIVTALSGRVTYLYFGQKELSMDVVIEIPSKHRKEFKSKFPPRPTSYFIGRRVQVRGLIEESSGRPKIKLTDTADIWLVE